MVEHRHYEQVYEIHKLRKIDSNNGHVSEIPRSKKMDDERICETHKSRRIEDDISSDDGYYGLSPPPPYSKDDLIGYKDTQEERRRSSCYSPTSLYSIRGHISMGE